MSLRFLQHIFQYHGGMKAKVAKHKGHHKPKHQGPKAHHTATTHTPSASPPSPTRDAQWNDQAGWKK